MHIKLLIFISLLAFAGCKEKIQKPVPDINMNELKEPLMKVNRKLSREEKLAIDGYVKRRNWNMTETGTGVRYMIIEQGSDETPASGDVVIIDFEISLLDGTVCYTSKESGPEHFVVDYDNVESGMHEAIKYLHKGDKAIIIIPSHRAFGLAGDMAKIPPLSTVIYKIHVLEIIPKQKKNDTSIK
ncbi:MAG: FKBP-type peptidyl-prolyl cis-trans isomerase [Flavobacteriales bacterium]|nr:FKBP-type peptidyl-prolyl cis-trans isomerase [Flavobacteriales bacterium]